MYGSRFHEHTTRATIGAHSHDGLTSQQLLMCSSATCGLHGGLHGSHYRKLEVPLRIHAS